MAPLISTISLTIGVNHGKDYRIRLGHRLLCFLRRDARLAFRLIHGKAGLQSGLFLRLSSTVKVKS
jgi:hypothetical protein